ncbi:mercury methylation corrinoid protein HgcA [Clostridium sp. WILCCON 0269]|uniref:Mercury methylation corrinoid protein HgcA n=1 Tax=Candidatus Clostridium eludens TaxID=3381663 RepID=A0ABW8SQ68_9CLOT
MDKINRSDSKKKFEKNSKIKIVRIKPKNASGYTSSECEAAENSCYCGSEHKELCKSTTKYDKKYKWIIGEISTSQGCVPCISTKLGFTDIWGTWKVRFGVNRMNYKINPGLYAVGTPDNTSPVLVTANYKLTFDILRKELEEFNAWIMVLDTNGVNVWCAAGKGAFGTKELVNRISKVRLSQIVSHKTLILPQLGAPGISAHQVTKQSGFKVVYGPVRAEDIKVFLETGMKATEEMREVRFNIIDRVVLTPVEFVSSFKIAMLVFGIMFLINLFAVNPFGVVDFYAFIGALLVGCVITPVLLPWIPVRAFAAKGWIMGLMWSVIVNILNGWPEVPEYGVLKTIAYLLILPSVASYYAMNFTGSSTYTSFSGVIKEMKVAVPTIVVSIGLGIVLLLVNSFIHM